MKLPFVSLRYKDFRRNDLEELALNSKEDTELWQEVIARAVGDNSFKKISREVLADHCEKCLSSSPSLFYFFALAELTTDAAKKTNYFAKAFALRAKNELSQSLLLAYAEHCVQQKDYLAALMLYLHACLNGAKEAKWIFDYSDYPASFGNWGAMTIHRSSTLIRLLIGLYLLSGKTPQDVEAISRNVKALSLNELLAMKHYSAKSDELWLQVARDLNAGMAAEWHVVLLGVEKAVQFGLLDVGYYFNLMSYLLSHVKHGIPEGKLQKQHEFGETETFLQDRLLKLTAYIIKLPATAAFKVIDNFTKEVLPSLPLSKGLVVKLQDEFHAAHCKVYLRENDLEHALSALDAVVGSRLPIEVCDFTKDQLDNLGYALFERNVLRKEYSIAANFLLHSPMAFWNQDVLNFVKTFDAENKSASAYQQKINILLKMIDHSNLNFAHQARALYHILASPFTEIEVLLNNAMLIWQEFFPQLKLTSKLEKHQEKFKQLGQERLPNLFKKREKNAFATAITDFGKWLDELKGLSQEKTQTTVKGMELLLDKAKKLYQSLPQVEVIPPTYAGDEASKLPEETVFTQLAAITGAGAPARKTAEEYSEEMMKALAAPPRPPSPIGFFPSVKTSPPLMPTPAMPPNLTREIKRP